MTVCRHNGPTFAFDAGKLNHALFAEYQAGNDQLAIRVHPDAITWDDTSRLYRTDVLVTMLGEVELTYDDSLPVDTFHVITRLDRIEQTVTEMREALEKLLAEDR